MLKPVNRLMILEQFLKFIFWPIKPKLKGPSPRLALPDNGMVEEA
jgi:hypothetical protein